MRERGERAMARPLSDWDVEVYARCAYGAEWESGPYAMIEAICRIERLKQFVGATVAATDTRTSVRSCTTGRRR